MESGMLLPSSDKGSEVTVLPGLTQVRYKYPFYSSCNTTFTSSLGDHPRICTRPQTGLLGRRPSLFNLNSTSRGNWSPHKLLTFIQKNRSVLKGQCVCVCVCVYIFYQFILCLKLFLHTLVKILHTMIIDKYNLKLNNNQTFSVSFMLVYN